MSKAIIDIDGLNNGGYNLLIRELTNTDEIVLYSSEVLKKAISDLTEKEQIVLERRLKIQKEGRPETFKSIANDFGVTIERIRQIEAKAYRKLKHRIEKGNIIYSLKDIIHSAVITDKEKEELLKIKSEIDKFCLEDESFDTKYCFEFLKNIKEKIKHREKSNISISQDFKQGILDGNIHTEELISYTYDDFIDLGLSDEKARELISKINGYIENYKSLINKGIEELNLSIRPYNCLKRSGVNTIIELIKLSEEEFNSIKSLGKNGSKEIKDALNSLGLYIGVSKVDDDLGELLDMDICELGFSVRTYNTLAKAGIRTLQKIVTMNAEEWENVRNLGPQSFNEIKEQVENLGLHLKIENVEGKFVSNSKSKVSRVLTDEEMQQNIIKRILEKQRRIAEQEEEISELESKNMEL